MLLVLHVLVYQEYSDAHSRNHILSQNSNYFVLCSTCMTMFVVDRMKPSSAEDLEKLEEITKKIKDCKEQYREMEDLLPHENG